MKEYLGDGLYADFDGYMFSLSAENGITATDTVYLEPHVLAAFMRYVEKVTTKGEKNESQKEKL